MVTAHGTGDPCWSFWPSIVSSLAQGRTKEEKNNARSNLVVCDQSAPSYSPGNPKTLVSRATELPRAKRISLVTASRTNISGDSLPYVDVQLGGVYVSTQPSIPITEERVSYIARAPIPCSTVVSLSTSDSHSLAMDESISICDSFDSPGPEVEYSDDSDVSVADSIDLNTFSRLYISESRAKAASNCDEDVLADREVDKNIVDIDNNYTDPHICTTIVRDIYQHLRESETKRRPSADFMERIQNDITAGMRAILIDWLVEVAEAFWLQPETLYLTVNYVDRYLSGNTVNSKHLQLLGVTCMMIAAKYEEVAAPAVKMFCYITDDTYFEEEVLQMESAVLKYLKFELTAPTAKCFLRRFVRAAQGVNEVSLSLLECIADFLAELSLLEYTMLSYAPSLIAASAVFLAKFMLVPSERPWDATLHHYTQYQPSDLSSCVRDMQDLCLKCHCSTLPAVRVKYSHPKYKSIAKKFCPPYIPREYFRSDGGS